jgi:hypothetical protein
MGLYDWRTVIPMTLEYVRQEIPALYLNMCKQMYFISILQEKKGFNTLRFEVQACVLSKRVPFNSASVNGRVVHLLQILSLLH